MARVCVVGSLNVDLVARAPRLPLAGETIAGASFATFAGGKGGNQAVAAARLGADVTIVGCVGDDDHGRRLLQGLRHEGIDTANVRVAGDRATGVALVTVADGGENTIVVVGGANQALTAADVDGRRAAIEAADVVVLQLETPVEAAHRAAALAAKAGKRVLLNAAPAPARLPVDLLRQTSILVANRLEAARLAKAPPQTDPPDLVRRLLQLGVRTAIVTLGARGAVLHDGANLLQQPAFPVRVVDTVAAGDAFVGAFSVALAEAAPMPFALRFACAAGSLAATRPGAQPSLPRRGDVQALAQ